jgi:hypothetical protein
MGDGRKLEKENECKKQSTCAPCKSKLPEALEAQFTLMNRSCVSLVSGLKFSGFGLVDVITFLNLVG